MALTRTHVLGAGAAAVAAAVALGVAGDAPGLADRECYRALVVAPCALAKSLAADAGEVSCAKGEVTLPIEFVVDKNASEPPASSAPEGVDVLEDTLEQIDCAKARRPDKAATVRDFAAEDTEVCIAGLVSYDTSAAGDGSKWRTWTEPTTCRGSRCRCDDPPCPRVACVEISGRATGVARYCEAHPDKCPEAPQ